MKSVCHFVPALLCALAMSASGCFMMHQAEGEPGERCLRPTGLLCCEGRTPLATHETVCPFRCPPGASLVSESECTGRPPPPPPPPGFDAGPRPADAGPLVCGLARADVTCLESFAVEPGRAFELPYAFDACGCCTETECVAEPDYSQGVLRLTTTMCPDPCDCDTCNTPGGACSVPPLTEGDWRVEVNGAHAFTLPVMADSGLVPPPAACASYADADDCDFGDGIDLRPSRPSTICVGPSFAADQSARIEMSFECPGCGELNGTCVVSLEPRTTRDLPPGGELYITSTLHRTDCDVACPPECSLRTHDCIIPTLEPGMFYRVWHDGTSVLSFTAGDGAAACAILDGIVPG